MAEDQESSQVAKSAKSKKLPILIGVIMLTATVGAGAHFALQPDYLNTPLGKLSEEQKRSLKDRLNEDDYKAFTGYLMRYGIRQVLKGEKADFDSMTVRQALTDQRAWQEDNDKQEKETADLKKKIDQEQKDFTASVAETLSATLVSKTLSDDIIKEVHIKIAFENKGQKEISGIKGITIFKDMFGDELMKTGLKIDDNIAPGKKIIWNGSKPYNQFDKEDIAFATADPDKIKFEFRPTTIIFKDGTQVSEEKISE